jgi:hypothetical protein
MVDDQDNSGVFENAEVPLTFDVVIQKIDNLCEDLPHSVRGSFSAGQYRETDADLQRKLDPILREILSELQSVQPLYVSLAKERAAKKKIEAAIGTIREKLAKNYERLQTLSRRQSSAKAATEQRQTMDRYATLTDELVEQIEVRELQREPLEDVEQYEKRLLKLLTEAESTLQDLTRKHEDAKKPAPKQPVKTADVTPIQATKRKPTSPSKMSLASRSGRAAINTVLTQKQSPDPSEKRHTEMMRRYHEALADKSHPLQEELQKILLREVHYDSPVPETPATLASAQEAVAATSGFESSAIQEIATASGIVFHVGSALYPELGNTIGNHSENLMSSLLKETGIEKYRKQIIQKAQMRANGNIMQEINILHAALLHHHAIMHALPADDLISRAAHASSIMTLCLRIRELGKNLPADRMTTASAVFDSLWGGPIIVAAGTVSLPVQKKGFDTQRIQQNYIDPFIQKKGPGGRMIAYMYQQNILDGLIQITEEESPQNALQAILARTAHIQSQGPTGHADEDFQNAIALDTSLRCQETIQSGERNLMKSIIPYGLPVSMHAEWLAVTEELRLQTGESGQIHADTTLPVATILANEETTLETTRDYYPMYRQLLIKLAMMLEQHAGGKEDASTSDVDRAVTQILATDVILKVGNKIEANIRAIKVKQYPAIDQIRILHAGFLKTAEALNESEQSKRSLAKATQGLQRINEEIKKQAKQIESQ